MVRKFGKIVVKPSKANPKWIEASYLTPVSAFSEWPDLPNRQTATFPCTQDGRDEAAAWLTRARRRIEADVWEPERIAKRKAKDHALTFAEYTAKWLKTREGEGLHANTIYGIRCTVKRLIDAFGGMPIGKITSADIERYAATLPKDHPYVGRELLSKLRQILDAAATPDQDGIAVIAKSPFAMQVRKPAPREETPAATPQQLRLIHDAMPRKFQLAITLAISCGGLRIGEVCAHPRPRHRRTTEDRQKQAHRADTGGRHPRDQGTPRRICGHQAGRMDIPQPARPGQADQHGRHARSLHQSTTTGRTRRPPIP